MASIFPKPAEEIRLLKEYLPAQGFFLDVGANDPVVNSQTVFLEDQGWTGILVEPQPRFAEQLRARRKAKVVQKACGAPGDKGKRLPLTILGTNAALYPERVGEPRDGKDTVEVELDTLDNILTSEGVKGVDYVSMDIEGYEIEALSGFSLDRFAPKLMLIEDHLFDVSKHSYLKNAGYKWVRRTQNNNWYVPANTLFPLSLLDKFWLFRKMYIGMPFRRFKRWLRAPKPH